MKKYQDTAARIEQYARDLNPFETLDRLQQYSFFSANLTNFLPLVDPQRHPDIFRQAYVNQQLSLLDEKYFGAGVPLDVSGWDDTLVDRLRDRPGIICTFHAGSYRMINYMLAKSRLPFALLIAGKAYEHQGPGFQKAFEILKQRHRLPHELFLIDAERPAAIWKLIRLVRKGYNIVVYMDGFTGMSVTDTAKLGCIPFLGQHLFVRQGAAYLSRKLDIPLYPIFSSRLSTRAVRFHSGTPVETGGIEPKIATDWALSRIMAEFAGTLLHFPAQWENWFFLHHQFAPNGLRNVDDDASGSRPGIGFPEPSEYGMIGQRGRYFLLKKKGYQTYPMPERTMKSVWEIWKTR